MKFTNSIVFSFCLFIASIVQMTNASEPIQFKEISLTNGSIRYLGTNYITRTENKVSFTRHSSKVLSLPEKNLRFSTEKAQTTSGISINFSTDSNHIQLIFEAVPSVNRGSEFAIYENGKLVESFKFLKKDKIMEINLKSQRLDANSEYELTLPSWSNVELISFKIEKTSKLNMIKSARKSKYIALGDSITHGVGQGSATHLTYPHLLAKSLNYQLYNLSVGGGKVSIPTAEMLEDFEDVSLITLLIGYNDLNASDADLAIFTSRYNHMISIIRRLQPNTPIYCITPLYTKTKKGKFSKVPVQYYRNAIAKLVNNKKIKDHNLYLIHGEQLTSEANLRLNKQNDPVHLGFDGARMFANELLQVIEKNL